MHVGVVRVSCVKAATDTVLGSSRRYQYRIHAQDTQNLGTWYRTWPTVPHEEPYLGPRDPYSPRGGSVLLYTTRYDTILP